MNEKILVIIKLLNHDPISYLSTTPTLIVEDKRATTPYVPEELIALMIEFTPVYLLGKWRVNHRTELLIEQKWNQLKQHWTQAYNSLLQTSSAHWGYLIDHPTSTTTYKGWDGITYERVERFRTDTLIQSLTPNVSSLDPFFENSDLRSSSRQFIDQVSQLHGGTVICGKHERRVKIPNVAALRRKCKSFVLVDLRRLKLLDHVIVFLPLIDDVD